MASHAGRRRRAGEQSWLSAMIGVVVLIGGGFLLGLVVGVVSEEPELVVGHVVGRSSEIEWASETAAGSGIERREAAASVRPAAPATSRPKGQALPAVGSLPSVAAAPPAVSGKAYSIQVGAFAENVSAERVAGELEAKGYPVHLLSPRGDDRWRVRVGPVSGRGEAETLARRLKIEERLPTWVLPQPSR